MKLTLLALTVAAQLLAQSGPPLTNQNVIAMTAAGILPGQLVLLISGNPCAYDLSPAGLQSLAVVPAVAVAAMRTCMGATAPSLAATPTEAPKMTKRKASADAASGTLYMTGSLVHGTENIQHGIAKLMQIWEVRRRK